MAVELVEIVNPNGTKGTVASTSKVAGYARDRQHGYRLPPSARQPAKSASAEVWRDYAVENGVPAEVAAGMTRDDLVAHFNAQEG